MTAHSNLEEILEGFREVLPCDALVNHQHRLIGKWIEILLRRHDLTAEEQVEAGGVEIAALERLGTEMVPERVQEGGIDAMLLGVVARPAGIILIGVTPLGLARRMVNWTPVLGMPEGNPLCLVISGRFAIFCPSRTFPVKAALLLRPEMRQFK